MAEVQSAIDFIHARLAEQVSLPTDQLLEQLHCVCIRPPWLIQIGNDFIDNNHFILYVKYADGRNRCWDDYVKQSRGLCLFVVRNKDTFTMTVLVQAMNRGPEIWTKKTESLSTQDAKPQHYDHFAPVQKAVVDYILGGSRDDYLLSVPDGNQQFALSQKVDGSLLRLSWTPIAISRYIEASIQNPYQKLIYSYCEFKGYEYFLNVGSSNRLWCDPKLLLYYMSAILGQEGKDVEFIYKYHDLSWMGEDSLWVLDQWSTRSDGSEWDNTVWMTAACLPFFDRLYAFTQEYGHCTICFETVIPQRTDLEGRVHRDLATSYPIYMCRFLGLTHGYGEETIGKYIPHFELQEWVEKLSLTDPLYWTVDDPTEMEELIEQFEQVVIGNIEFTNFLVNMKAQNKRHLTDEVYDPEGFVLFTFGEGIWQYHKIKLIYYYWAHCLQENLGDLEKMVASNKCLFDRFPKLQVIHVIHDKLVSFVPELIDTYQREHDTIISMEPKCLEGRDDKVCHKIVMNRHEYGMMGHLTPLAERYFTMEGKPLRKLMKRILVDSFLKELDIDYWSYVPHIVTHGKID